MTLISIIVGTRPQIIKSVPVIQEALAQGLDVQIIHTGQHYDYALSKIFFDELAPPEPFANLNVGSGSHAFQMSEIMKRLEKYLVEERPSLVLVPGDTNSALAAAVTSVKIGIPVAHIESGARSYDMHMAEEINRRLIDHCSQILFAPTEKCEQNLKQEQVRGDVFLSGDTMYDIFISFQNKANKSDILSKLGLSNNEYALLTTHRAENVDHPNKIKSMLQAIERAGLPVVFPIHPRTKSRMVENGITLSDYNIKPVDPVGYIEMLKLLKHAKIVITDSGGLQKEAFWSKVPCITIRDRTEWMETVERGVNYITDIDPEKIRSALKYITLNYGSIKEKFSANPYGNGKASKVIVETIQSKLRTEY